MQRIIKFRGKRIDNGEWATGSLVIDTTGKRYSIIDYANSDSDTYSWHDVIPETIGQCLCEKDKYGQKLFEGDIYQTVGCPTRRYKIMFISGAFVGGEDEQNCNPLGWDGDEVGDFSWICKIGNIHDHPHLLNPPKEGVLNMNTDPKEGQQEVKEDQAAINAAEDQANTVKEPDSEEGTTEG